MEKIPHTIDILKNNVTKNFYTIFKIIFFIIYLLKGFSKLAILSLPLTLLELNHETLTTILTFYIYCIIIYDCIPLSIEPILGDITHNKLFKISILISSVCIYITMQREFIQQKTLIFDFCLCFLLLCNIYIGQIMFNESKIDKWSGPIPNMHDFFHNKKLGMIKSKYFVFISIYSYSLLTLLFSVFFSLIMQIFTFSSQIFTTVVAIWLVNNISKLTTNKSFLKMFIKKISSVETPEEKVLKYLRLTKNLFIKQIASIY